MPSRDSQVSQIFPFGILSRSAVAALRAALETVAGVERQGSALLRAISGNNGSDDSEGLNGPGGVETYDSAKDVLEAFFDQRVARVLNALQIPTRDDIRELNERVQTLTAEVARLQSPPAGAGAKPAGRAKKPVRKAAVRKNSSKS